MNTKTTEKGSAMKKTTETESTTAHIGSIFLPLTVLNPNGWNKTRPIEPEFVASIKSQGVIQPILARRHPKLPGQFEIVCGERRYTASKQAGLTGISVVVRELDDAQAQLCTFLENHHRADMTPFQEAEVLETASKRPGFTVAGAAATLGWSEGKVRRRMKMLELTEDWREFLAEDGLHFTAEMIEAIAAYPAETQDRLRSDWRIRGASDMAELRECLAEHTHTLDLAPFDIKDATLNPKAGACTSCPLRSSACVDLFGDTEETGKGDKCLSSECWNGKIQAGKAASEAKAKAEYGTVLKISKVRNWNHNGELGTDSYKIVKKSTPGATAAIFQDGPREGQVVFVIAEEETRTRSEKPSKAAQSPAEAKAAKVAEISLRRWVHISKAVQEELEQRREKVGDLSLYTLAVFASAFGIHKDLSEENPWSVVQSLDEGGHDKIREALWWQVVAALERNLELRYWSGLDVEKVRRSAMGVCDLLEISAADLLAKATEEIPDPPSWSKEPKAKPSKARDGKSAAANDDSEDED